MGMETREMPPLFLIYLNFNNHLFFLSLFVCLFVLEQSLVLVLFPHAVHDGEADITTHLLFNYFMM